MTLLTLVVTLVIIGILLWALNTYLPMDGRIKQILNIVVIICVIVWLLQVFGLLGSLGSIVSFSSCRWSSYPSSPPPLYAGSSGG